ncbi:Excinuclease ABC subunit C [Pseudobutyrivibrio sp. NOR37]|uniref:UvrABC system protein C n=1 Tax=Pseudobutyrivibrio xylanivorans TaxID=185007 RepID=A0A6M0LG99_PSEXY|nr:MULTISPECIES: excinuclease ABC subunit UvrC [Pseudobutyrivibrio]NEX01602.1 excinuclease ABC subunit UvrC [Pseudobutyrivibrio xylanivorans]SFR70472.1 Excinuclease ABC subunit C [Pseudobutyrivibrio sp. NOR37]
MVTEKDLSKLPDQPGVYLMHGRNDEIIYVGKARSLKNRVRQYFQPSHDEGLKKKQMVANIDYFEFIVTDSELEALILECNLIKEYRPKYNTMLRDDKTYPYIEVTLTEDYPRVLFSRRMKKNGSKFFGPFTSAGAVHDTVELVQKLYKIRTCNKKFPESFGKGRPCLNYHIGQCLGVCQGNVSKEEYGKNVEKVIQFLDGDYNDTLKDLQEKMLAASEEMDFEKAAIYRDLIESVEACAGRQKATQLDGEDRDIIAMARTAEDAVVQVFFIRGGKMIGREHFFINVRVDDKKEDLLEYFIKDYYTGTPFIPREIFVQFEIDEVELLEKWLTDKKGSRVYIRTPKRGDKEKLVELAAKNAQMVLDQDREKIKKEEGRTIGAMKEIAELLGLPGASRMEAYDISNISGFQSVGSMVVFEKGKPKRSDYRKFKIKTVEGPNDYASMHEVLTRRFSHGIEELEANGGVIEDSFTKFPDIIMMDGGKGQVHIAKQVLSELGLHIPVAGMVKDDHHRTRGLYFNDVELPIDTHSEGFKLITRLQDEAHRFAIEYHRSLRSKGQVHSFLDDIDGIGPKRRKALMKKYVSAEKMAQASIENLMETEAMSKEAAENVYNYFHPVNSKGNDIQF